MVHKVIALQPVKFRTSVIRQVEVLIADRTVTRPRSQDEWVFLRAGEVHESSNPITGIHPDYLPGERPVSNGGTSMIIVPTAPRPLEFRGLIRLESGPERADESTAVD